ncbi:hypothetical protein [Micromonospora inyonensis]|uniref:DUF5709 domain-containing protein n=1 Tax=Micromonospora inyonensis TaxID=47866 RepID=A0A1C6R7Y8_9ACTN|nr:hypothetical protein [Micromonospora inyonensis]SCL12996.1 hypothetical protein GA0074694_0108 [Micromonospora inyonensis]
MTDRDRNADRPLEESPEMAAAADDETTVPQLVTGGGPDDETPDFVAPGESPAGSGGTDELVGDAYAGTSGVGRTTVRTGGEQPWDPADLAVARGQDPDPENVERARRDLERDGRAAVERTVP